MSRQSLTRHDYEELAASRGLKFTGTKTPYSVFDKTYWVCLHCGKEHYKTQRAVQLKTVGCICQTNMTLKDEDYNALAAKYNLKWIGTRPANTNENTEWQTPSGKKLVFPYARLAYRPAKKFLTLLEVSLD